MPGENEAVQSNGEAQENYEALYDQVMQPNVEPSEPTEGAEANQEAPASEPVKPEPSNTDEWTLKHKSFEDGERKFSADKVTEYAQKGFDYELKMHQLKQQQKEFDELKSQYDTDSKAFSEKREYWEKIDQYMSDNPDFQRIVQEQWAQVQGQNAQMPVSPEVQSLREEIASLQEHMTSEQVERQQASQKRAEESFVESTARYKDNHSDFDWETKDEFGKDLQTRIEEHAIENGFKNFKDAANALLFDQHLKRAALKAKEEAAKELQEQRKLGLGPITDRSQRRTKEARSIGQMSYSDLASEALSELGITD